MGKEVRWTNEALTTFELVIDYLNNKWTDNEIENFIFATNKCVIFIAQNPRLFRETNIKNVHEALITSHNLLIYKVYPTHIDLITFWDTRQNPIKKIIKKDG